MALKIGNVTVTRRKNYDRVKHYIANQILLFNDYRVPPTRELAEDLQISNSSVSRVLLQLCEEDNWLEKIDRGSPRNSYYKIIANWDQCEQYKNYYLLPDRKKRKFKKMCKQVGQKQEAGQKTHWGFGTKEWAKFFAKIQAKQ